MSYSKTRVKRSLSIIPKIGFQDELSLNAGQKYCRMLCGEHSAILSTFIKLLFVIKIFVLSIFECPFTQLLLSMYLRENKLKTAAMISVKTAIPLHYKSVSNV